MKMKMIMKINKLKLKLLLKFNNLVSWLLKNFFYETWKKFNKKTTLHNNFFFIPNQNKIRFKNKKNLTSYSPSAKASSSSIINNSLISKEVLVFFLIPPTFSLQRVFLFLFGSKAKRDNLKKKDGSFIFLSEGRESLNTNLFQLFFYTWRAGLLFELVPSPLSQKLKRPLIVLFRITCFCCLFYFYYFKTDNILLNIDLIILFFIF